MKKLIITTIAAVMCLTSFSQEGISKNYYSDTDSIDHILYALYEVISGEAGQRDWERFRNLFTEDASLNAKIFDQAGKPQYITGTVENYIEGVDEYFTQSGFYEEELGRRIMHYSDLANVFSVFESRLTADGPVYQRGINAIQLIFVNGRWYIANLIYNTEKQGEPIPDEFINFE